MPIRPVNISDASVLAEIYNHYILHSTITFEETTVDTQDMASRISDLTAQNFPWYIAESPKGIVMGYAYASPWKGRCAYRYAAEVTVYLSPQYTAKGIGSALYAALFSALESLGYHTLIAGISLPNPASIKLHEKFGMEKAAHFKDIGFKFGRRIDVGYWQGFLEVKCD